MHAIDDKGNIYTGVDSFREIWRRLPYYNKLVPLSEVDILKPAYNLGYSIFAKYIRPNLPKKNAIVIIVITDFIKQAKIPSKIINFK